MAILLNDNIQIEAGKHVDNKYGPYNDLASVLTSIPSFKRVRGLTVGVIESGLLKEYWFKEGTNNSDLVEKITSAQSGGGGVGTDTGVRSLTANWQSTYATVSSLSSSWGSGGGGLVTSVIATPDPLKYNFTGNGTTTNFTVSGTNGSTNASYIEVYVDSVRQEPTFTYTLSAETVRFVDPPESGSFIFIITPNLKNTNSLTGSGLTVTRTFVDNTPLLNTISIVNGSIVSWTQDNTWLLLNGIWSDSGYWNDGSSI